MSTTSATSTTTASSLSSAPNATSSLSSVLSSSAQLSSAITTAATTLSLTVFSTMSTSASISSLSLSALTSSFAMSSSTSSPSLSISSASTTTSESLSSSPTTSFSSFSTIHSSTSSSTLTSSTSSSSTQDPSTTTSQTISSRTTDPGTTSSSTSSSSSVLFLTSPSSAVEPTSSSAPATTLPTTTTTHTSNTPSVFGVLTETTVTSIFTTTSNGRVTTITQVSVSQTLSPNKTNSKDNSFFQNTGAVAGVFVVVGLAAASIFLWILFALRRRRRTRRLEHDTAVSATLAAAGFHRTPLDDDDENGNVNGSRRSRFGSPEVEMHNRTSSGFASTILSGARTSAYFDSSPPDDPDGFNPYRDYVVDTSASGTLPPSSAFLNGNYRDRTSSGGEHTHDHTASGSYEPLLASYYRQQEQATSFPVPPSVATPPNPPPRNPLRLSDAGRSPPLGVLSKTLPDIAPAESKSRTGDSSAYSSESIGDDRLDPGLRQRIHEETDRASQRDLKDEEDYSRPVLGVRNLPNASEASQEA